MITATTGVAACNFGGSTIHRFSGIGMGNGPHIELANRVVINKNAKARWREVDILVVNGISMMTGSFLENLSFVASRGRGNWRPFGGVQLVVCEEFFQLPPVELSKGCFVFETECWGSVINCSVLLKQVFRQQDDKTLMKILDEARLGELSDNAAATLKRHSTMSKATFDSNGNDNDRAKEILSLCSNVGTGTWTRQTTTNFPSYPVKSTPSNLKIGP